MSVIKIKSLSDILLNKKTDIDNSNFIKEQHFALVQDIFSKNYYCVLEDNTKFYLGKYLPNVNPIMTLLTDENLTDQRLLIDNGSVEITDKSPESVNLLFKGKKYFDRFMLTKTSLPSSYVLHNLSQKTRRTLSIQITSIERIETKEKDLAQTSVHGALIKRYKGIALAEGIWNNTFYPWKIIRSRGPEIVGKQIREEHGKSADDVHGFIDKQIPNNELKELGIEFSIFTKRGQELIDKSKKEGLSVGIDVEVKFNSELKKDEALDLSWFEGSIVGNPACKKCWIDSAM